MLAFFWTYWLVGLASGPADGGGGSSVPARDDHDLRDRGRPDRATSLRAAPTASRSSASACSATAGLARDRRRVALLLGLILVPPLRDVFGLAPPAPTEWVIVLGFPAVMVLLDEGRKALQRARGR